MGSNARFDNHSSTLEAETCREFCSPTLAFWPTGGRRRGAGGRGLDAGEICLKLCGAELLGKMMRPSKTRTSTAQRRSAARGEANPRLRRTPGPQAPTRLRPGPDPDPTRPRPGPGPAQTRPRPGPDPAQTRPRPGRGADPAQARPTRPSPGGRRQRPAEARPSSAQPGQRAFYSRKWHFQVFGRPYSRLKPLLDTSPDSFCPHRVRIPPGSH